MNGTSKISRHESLPPLLTFASNGAYPLLPDTSLGDSFQSSRGASRCFSFSDVEKGARNLLSPDYDDFRISSPRTCELGDEAFQMEGRLSTQTCHSERKSAVEIRSSTGVADMSRKEVDKGSLRNFTFGRNKIVPAFSEENIEAPNGISFAKERSKKIGCKKAYDNRKTAPREQFFSQPNAGSGLDNPALLQKLQGHSGPLPGCNEQKNATVKNESNLLFSTKVPKLERSLSRLHFNRHQEQQGQHGISDGEFLLPGVQIIMPVQRYLDALNGPELDILKDSEDTLLPVDKIWPFLLRFPIGCFGICLGLGNQTILWKTLSTAESVHFLHVPSIINLTLWCLALMTLLAISTTYSLKCIFYFEAVRREFYHPVRINFFFAPWIACMFLTLGVPPAITRSINPMLFLLFMTPIFVLELKIYGQWLSGGERKLSKVANPSTYLSLVGNFVGALLAATAGWIEIATFFWAVGLAHYLVLFVTLYQRLPTAAVLPKELHPVFFLFVAAPSTASVAWSKIMGDFGLVSRITYFVGLFLYSSLVVRINFFRGFRFSVAWWAYTFPMTGLAIATLHYSLEVKHPFTQGLAVLLSSISTIAVLSMCLLTILHIFVWCDMFPNDMAIAITSGNFKEKRKIKKSEKDSLPSCISPESMSNEERKAWRFGNCFSSAVQALELHQVSLPTVKSESSPKNPIDFTWM